MMYSDTIFNIVIHIPKGKVTTYGAIAKKVGVSPRVVGWALHRNPDPANIPCHRVVDRNGRVAESYAFGGAEEQKRKLLVEGVEFRDEKHVDLKSAYFY